MELSTETKTSVIVTKLGDFWVDAHKAKSIASGMDDKAGKAVIEEFGIISMSQIYAVLTREGYEVYQKKQAGKWQCNTGVWHEKFSKCNCRKDIHRTPKELGMETDNRTELGEGYEKFKRLRDKMVK